MDVERISGEMMSDNEVDEVEELREMIRLLIIANNLWPAFGIDSPDRIGIYLETLSPDELEELKMQIDEHLNDSENEAEEEVSDDDQADFEMSDDDSDVSGSASSEYPDSEASEDAGSESGEDGGSGYESEEESLAEGDASEGAESEPSQQDYDVSSEEEECASQRPCRRSKKRIIREKMQRLAKKRWAKDRERKAAERREQLRRKRRRYHRSDNAAFGVLLFGARVSQIDSVMRFTRADFPCKSTLSKRLKVISGEILQWGHKRLCREYKNVPRGSTAQTDGAWAHSRRSTQHTMPLRCVETGKIVYLSILTGTQEGPKRTTHKGNCAETPQGLEGYALRTIAKVEATRPGGSRFKRLVTDMQTSVASICRSEGWKVSLEVDAGHVMRAVHRRIEAMIGYTPPGRRNRKIVLSGIKDAIASWFYGCATMAAAPAAKEKKFMGMIAHFLSADSGWQFKRDPLAVDLLSRLAVELKPYLHRFQKDWNTQACESYNALKANLADKNFSWKETFGARAMIAALRANYAFEWVSEFCAEYGIELEPGVADWLHEESQRILARRASRRTEEGRREKNAVRKCRDKRLVALARERRGKESPYARQSIVEDDSPVRDVTRKLRKDLKRAPPCFPSGDGRELTIGFVGLDNEPGTLCHLNADLQLLIALPELSVPDGVVITSRGEASDVWAELVADYRAAGEHGRLDTADFRGFLVRTPEFRTGGVKPKRGREKDWFTKFQSPSETYERLVRVFGDVHFEGPDGEWDFRDIVRFATIDEIISSSGQSPCWTEDADEVRFGVCINAQPYNVPAAAAADGAWLLQTPTFDRHNRAAFCAKCGLVHGFGTVTSFIGLPPVLAVDFGAALIDAPPGAFPRLQPVRAPMALDIPIGPDDERAHYELFGFVELRDSHCIAYVRMGPRAFVAYNDGSFSYASIPADAEQISGFVSLALYRQ
jgi:hypothetical protein